MLAKVRQAADDFLAQTYGFSPETRASVLDRAATEIVADCRELSAAATTDREAVKRRAHRLKGHLLPLGLTALAQQAKALELLAGAGGGASLTDAVRDLCRALLREPPA